MVESMPERDGANSLASPVAIAKAAQSIISSTVATARTILAKWVSMILRSMKILDITGIEVTATAIPIIMANDSGLPLGPE